MGKYWPLLQKFFKWTDNICRGSSFWFVVYDYLSFLSKWRPAFSAVICRISRRGSIIMLFTTTCWYVCWASEITAVGAIKKKKLLSATMKKENFMKSMKACLSARGNMHVMHLTNQWQAREKKIDMSLVFIFCLDLCVDSDPLVLIHLV